MTPTRVKAGSLVVGAACAGVGCMERASSARSEVALMG
jgi:hypothetical protein